MTGINWNLSGANQGFMNSLRLGMEMGGAAREAKDRREYRSALADLANDPENQNALAVVFQHDPRTGAALMDRADEKAFGRDLAVMVNPNGAPNALLGLGSSASPPAGPRQLNALAPRTPAPENMQSVGQAAVPAAQEGEQSAPAGVDVSALGQPRSDADAAFLRMVQRDPSKALKIRSELRDNFVAQLEAESDFYGLAMGELSRATDPASWSAALQSLMPRAQALGMDLARVVPAEYPGPEAVAELMRRAQPIKEQLDLMVREANIEADNERADRNTDSLIETREGRLAEYERNNRARLATTRRGQDMTDSRLRSRSSGKRGGKKARETLPTIASPAEAMKLPSGTKFRTPSGQVKVRP